MTEENRYLTVVLIVMGTLILWMYSVKFSVAHDHNHPELDSWFRSLHAKDGAWCCDGNDAEIADWDMQDGHYRVRIDEQWVDVPEGSVVEGPNKVGGARVWPYYTSGRPNVRCFLPGSMT